jgi:hypothetical protein
MQPVSWGCRISAYTISRKKKETDRPHATAEEHLWIEVGDTVQLRTQRVTRELRTQQTDRQPNACLDQRSSHARPDNSPPIRAERHTDADLARALRDAVGYNSVQSERRQRERSKP